MQNVSILFVRTKQGHIGPINFSTPSVYSYPSFKDLPSVRGGDAFVGFYGGIDLWKLRRFLRLCHPHCHCSGASISFCEADSPMGVVSFLSHLFTSLNFFVKTTPSYRIHIYTRMCASASFGAEVFLCNYDFFLVRSLFRCKYLKQNLAQIIIKIHISPENILSL